MEDGELYRDKVEDCPHDNSEERLTPRRAGFTPPILHLTQALLWRARARPTVSGAYAVHPLRRDIEITFFPSTMEI